MKKIFLTSTFLLLLVIWGIYLKYMNIFFSSIIHYVDPEYSYIVKILSFLTFEDTTSEYFKIYFILYSLIGIVFYILYSLFKKTKTVKVMAILMVIFTILTLLLSNVFWSIYLVIDIVSISVIYFGIVSSKLLKKK